MQRQSVINQCLAIDSIGRGLLYWNWKQFLLLPERKSTMVEATANDDDLRVLLAQGIAKLRVIGPQVIASLTAHTDDSCASIPVTAEAEQHGECWQENSKSP